MRDALVAALSLDIFNRHADKVVMTNIAQTVNVLQAMVLTEENGTRMLVTPTYHVYDLYKDHQGGSALPVSFEAGEIAFPNAGKLERLAGLSGSASLKGKTLTLSVVNSSASEALEAEIVLRGGAAAGGAAQVLAHADIHAHNTFDAPEAVCPQAAEFQANGPRLHFVFPAASVCLLTVEIG
jgi:alpha-N-arabinofuranosidase